MSETARKPTDKLKCYVQLRTGQPGAGKPSRGNRRRKKITLYHIGGLAWVSADVVRWKNLSGVDETLTHWSLWDEKRGGDRLGDGEFVSDYDRRWSGNATFALWCPRVTLNPIVDRLLPA